MKGDLIRVTVATPPTTTVVILEALGEGHSVRHEWLAKEKRLEVQVLNRREDKSRGQRRPDNLVRSAEFAETSVISVEELTRAELVKESQPPKSKSTRKPRQPKSDDTGDPAPAG